MSTARRFKRPVRSVRLPGDDSVHVRGLTLAELRRVDARVAGCQLEPAEQATMLVVLVAAEALVEADGARVFPESSAEDLDAVAELFTPDQLEAVFAAAAGRSKADAKN